MMKRIKIKLVSAALAISVVFVSVVGLAEGNDGDVLVKPPEIALISLDMDDWLLQYYPNAKWHLPPMLINYSADHLSAGGIATFSFDPTAFSAQEFGKYRERMLSFISTFGGSGKKGLIDQKLFFLLGDLELSLGLNGSPEMLKAACEHYLTGIKMDRTTQASSIATYNYALALLELGETLDSIKQLRIAELKFSNEPAILKDVRSLMMEAYYRRGRYERAEDYLWSIAKETSQENVSISMLARYGDSVYKRGEYAKAIDWYEKYGEMFKNYDTDAVIRASAVYYAESLFRMGKFAEAQKYFAHFVLREDEYWPFFMYRLIACDQMMGEDEGVVRSRYKGLAQKAAGVPVALASQLAVARMNFLRGGSDEHTDTLTMPDGIVMPKSLETSFDQLLSSVAFKRGEYDKVIALVKKISAGQKKSANEVWGNDMLVAVLTHMYPIAKRENATLGFLELCEKHVPFIANSHYAQEMLYVVAKAYLDSGLDHTARRMFSKIMTKFEIMPEIADRINITLANMALDDGDQEIAELAIKSIINPTQYANDTDYLVAKARIEFVKEKYMESRNFAEKAVMNNVSAVKRLQLEILIGKAMKGMKEYESSLDKFLAVLGPIDTFPQHNIIEQQEMAASEVIDSFIKLGEYAKATAFFERIRNPYLENKPQPQIIFALVDAYRRQSKYDESYTLWENFCKVDGRVGDDLAKSYGNYLKAKRQTEMVNE